MINATELFSELRALLHDDICVELAERAYETIAAFYEDAAPAERERFEHEYLTYVREQMKAWPDALRSSPLFGFMPGELLLSRVLVLGYGKSGKEIMKALEVSDPELFAHFIGVRIQSSEAGEPEHILNAISRLIPVLRHVELEIEHGIEGTIDWLATHHGESIEHLSLRPYIGIDPHKRVDEYAGVLIDSLDRFPALRSIDLDHVTSPREPERWFPRLMKHPIARRLTSLSFSARADLFQDSWLTEPNAWSSLEKLRALGLPEDRAMAIARSPSLRHVKIWNLSENSWGRSRHWLDPKTRMWTARARGDSPDDVLQKENVSMTRLSAEQLDAIFFDEESNLRTSTRTRQLQLGWISRQLFDALIARSHDAYPNLETLEIRGADFISPSDYRALQNSPLWQRVDFSWSHLQIAPTYHRHLSQQERELRVQEWVEVAHDKSLDLTLRQLAWDTLLHCAPDHSDCVLLARAAKLRGRSKVKKTDMRDWLIARGPSE